MRVRPSLFLLCLLELRGEEPIGIAILLSHCLKKLLFIIIHTYMYKILIQSETVTHPKQTPFRKIVQLDAASIERDNSDKRSPILKTLEIKGRIHLLKHYQAQRKEQVQTTPNLSANKIEIKTQVLLISQLDRQQLNPIMQQLDQRQHQIDTLDIINEPNYPKHVSLVLCLNSILASEEIYQLVLFNFHALPLYLQQTIFVIVPLSNDNNRQCIALANPKLNDYKQQQSFVLQQKWIELPRCLACLERLQYDLTGISSVLQLGKPRPRANPCLTCLTLLAKQPTACALCGSSQDNWICMVCSRIGCGRYKNADAFKHFIKEGHIITMDLQSQHVWNYLADCFSHRVIPLQKQEVTLKFPDVSQRSQRYEESLQGAFWEYCSVVSEELQRQRNFYERQKNEEEELFKKELAKTEAQCEQARKQLKEKEQTLKKLNKKSKKTQKRLQQVRQSCKIQRQILSNYQQTIRQQAKQPSMAQIQQTSEKIQQKLKILQGLDSQIDSILLKLTQS